MALPYINSWIYFDKIWMELFEIYNFPRRFVFFPLNIRLLVIFWMRYKIYKKKILFLDEIGGVVAVIIW
jgi:hypothetical protein